MVRNHEGIVCSHQELAVTAVKTLALQSIAETANNREDQIIGRGRYYPDAVIPKLAIPAIVICKELQAFITQYGNVVSNAAALGFWIVLRTQHQTGYRGIFHCVSAGWSATEVIFDIPDSGIGWVFRVMQRAMSVAAFTLVDIAVNHY